MNEKCIYCHTNVNCDNLRYHDVYECPKSTFVEAEKSILKELLIKYEERFKMMGDDYGRNDRYYNTVLEKLAKYNDARMHKFINNYTKQFENRLSQEYIKNLLNDKLIERNNELIAKCEYFEKNIQKEAEKKLTDFMDAFYKKVLDLENRIDEIKYYIDPIDLIKEKLFSEWKEQLINKIRNIGLNDD